jgi:hypothetical protein
MPSLPPLPPLPRKRAQVNERCTLCGCQLHRLGAYARPTVEGRSHASEHHFVAERFFGRSSNRRGTVRERVFTECPWGIEGKSAVYCYDCHEELLHNPVFTETQMRQFSQLVALRGLNEDAKPIDRDKLAGRIRLLNEVIAEGLRGLLVAERESCTDK